MKNTPRLGRRQYYILQKLKKENYWNINSKWRVKNISTTLNILKSLVNNNKVIIVYIDGLETYKLK